MYPLKLPNEQSENTKRAWRIRAIAESRREAGYARRAPRAKRESRSRWVNWSIILAAGVVGAVLGVIIVAELLGPR